MEKLDTDTSSKGNDLELDPNREPEPPVKVMDKPVQRTGKRNPGAEAPSNGAPRAAAGQTGTWNFWMGVVGMGGMETRCAEGRGGLRRAERHGWRRMWESMC